ncbi:MAG: hypothetical protein Q7Q73_06015 [Verrucomicrobiota bacterium JB024]|nr:hypothetical protein [Verrucomicrobiota bacterium JB024]
MMAPLSAPPLRPTEDDSHLNMLATAHKVIGIVGMVFACVPLIHVTIGILVLTGALNHSGHAQAPALAGLMFVLIGGLIFLVGQALAVCTLRSGRFLRERRNYTFSFVIGCILCTVFPIGTALGIFTLIVLSRPSVKQLYGRTF